MLYILGKLLSVILFPIFWAFILLIWCLKTNNIKRKKYLLVSATVILFIFSNEFITDMTIGKWEFRYNDRNYCPEKQGNYEYAIVLGGMTWYNTKTNKPQFLRSGDRLFQAIWLLKQNYIKKIIFTGGSGSLTSPDIKEGVNIKKWLNQIGIADSLLIIESKSNSTHENAEFTKQILDSLGHTSKKSLLITSAAHMRRSMACFRKAGINNITPYPTDYYCSEFRIELDHCLIPSADAVYANYILIHEIVGYIMYKIIGYC